MCQPRFLQLILLILIQEDNSLSNLYALRGILGARPRPGSLRISLARHALSMRKSCLESYTLELNEQKNVVTIVNLVPDSTYQGRIPGTGTLYILLTNLVPDSTHQSSTSKIA